MEFKTDIDTDCMEESKQGVAFLQARLNELYALGPDDWNQFRKKIESFLFEDIENAKHAFRETLRQRAEFHADEILDQGLSFTEICVDGFTFHVENGRLKDGKIQQKPKEMKHVNY